MRKIIYVGLIGAVILSVLLFAPKGLISTYIKAQYGDTESQFQLGSTYFFGATNGIDWLHKAAENKHIMAQRWLARAYDTGTAVPKSVQDSIYWYRQAAEQNDVKSQIILAQIYENGEGVPKDIKESLSWYQKAADNNDAYAQTRMGIFYQEGLVVPVNFIKAISYHEKAASQNYEYAQINLGNLLEHMDINGSRQWYRKAIEHHGSALAKFYLGKSYYVESPPNYSEAVKWFLEAAEANEVNSLNALGHIYETGGGANRDLDVAAKFYKQAAIQGNEVASDRLKDMKQRYCKSQVKDSLRLCSVLYR